MSQRIRKTSFSTRDYMIARHSTPTDVNRSSGPQQATQEDEPETVINSNTTPDTHSDHRHPEDEATITSTSILNLLTKEGETLELHTSKQVAKLSLAMEEMKRLDIEFGHKDAKSETEREILLQEMLPEFLPMRAVWKQEWNILRRRKADILRDRWEQGIRRQEEVTLSPTFDLTSEVAKTATAKKKRKIWRRVASTIWYIFLLFVLCVVFGSIFLNLQHIQEVLSKMERMDFFL